MKKIVYWVELYNGMMLDFDTEDKAMNYCIMNGIHPENIYEEEEDC